MLIKSLIGNDGVIAGPNVGIVIDQERHVSLHDYPNSQSVGVPNIEHEGGFFLRPKQYFKQQGLQLYNKLLAPHRNRLRAQ